MTITLPKGWGPATVVFLLYALGVVVGGVIEIAQGDMSLAEYLNTDAVKVMAGSGAVLSIGRGLAYGLPGTGFGEPERPAQPGPDYKRLAEESVPDADVRR